MSGRHKAYHGYKDSGVEWLGEIPDGWEIKKLKFLAHCFPSNVDKKTKAGEPPIGLCNYTDVYYNDDITDEIDFMKASATKEQIERFQLIEGDVIITKDSEAPSDIAVPAVVRQSMHHVICGYHLAMIRAKRNQDGYFIKRLFDSWYARCYYSTVCNGLTRYGLGTYALVNASFPNPPLPEQQKIASFLDYETAKIDTLIKKQEKLIALLEEKRQAVISHAVTKGLDPNAKMKDSGVEWLGEIPENWHKSTLKHLCYINDGNHGEEYPKESDFVDKELGVPFIRAGDFDANKIIDNNLRYLSKNKNESMRKGNLQENDILFVNRGATIGKLCLVSKEYNGANLNSQIAYLRVTSQEMEPKYVMYFLSTEYIQTKIVSSIYGGALPQYPIQQIIELDVWSPSLKVQQLIVNHIESHIEMVDSLIAKAQKVIEILKERKTSLISSAVTGKIDLRDWEPPTPISA